MAGITGRHDAGSLALSDDGLYDVTVIRKIGKLNLIASYQGFTMEQF
jgi:hypothetical protein